MGSPRPWPGTMYPTYRQWLFVRDSSPLIGLPGWGVGVGAMYPTYPGVGSGTLYPGRARQNRVSSFCLPLLLLTKTCGHARCSTLCPHIIEEIISNLAFLGVVVEFSECPVKGSSFSTICPTLKKLKYVLYISCSYLDLFISGGVLLRTWSTN